MNEGKGDQERALMPVSPKDDEVEVPQGDEEGEVSESERGE